MLTIINRNAFGDAVINLPNENYKDLKNCVWYGPEGYSSKPALRPVYGDALDRLFRVILKVPNATSTDARKYLGQLRNDLSTKMADVVEVYVFLQTHCTNR